MSNLGHPDRDALLYYEVATGLFEEATELHKVGDTLAAIDSVKAGVRTLALAAKLVTTPLGEKIIRDALVFWSETLADLNAELAEERDDAEWRQSILQGV